MTEKRRTRPPHEPTKATREVVSLHSSVGTPQSVIADILDVDLKTLRKYYRRELDLALARANAAIGGTLYNRAKEGDTAAMIFWLKTRAGWREPRPDHELELARLQAEKLRRELEPPKAEAGVPQQEYTLSPDEPGPSNPVL